MYALLAIAALLIIYLVAFVVANSNRVEVSFVVADAHASLIWVMLVCTAIGVVIGIVLAKLWGRTRGVRTSSTPGPGATTTTGGGGHGHRPDRRLAARRARRRRRRAGQAIRPRSGSPGRSAS